MSKKETTKEREFNSANLLKLDYLKEQYEIQLSSFKQIDSRTSNRLAIFAAFLVVIMSSTFQLYYFFLHSTNRCMLWLIFITFALLIFFFSASVFCILKQLMVKFAKPAVIEKGFLNNKIPEYKVIDSFIQNYLKSYFHNKKLIEAREKLGKKLFRLNKITFSILLFYLLLLGICIMFFVNNKATLE